MKKIESQNKINKINNAAQISKVTALKLKIDTVLDPLRSNPKWGMDGSVNWEAFIRTIALLPSQSYGTRIENRIAKESGFKSVKKNENKGDFLTSDGEYFECKATILKHDKSQINFVQIRPHHKTNYYLIAFDIRKDFLVYPFLLTSKDMKNEIEAIGHIAHGNTANDTTEYRITIPANAKSKIFKRWMKRYYIEDHNLFKKYQSPKPIKTKSLKR